ncbi:glycoside hydrolase family 1 protein [Candidatus Bathyarchaeota archaeon]|nr:glycoside hydrolase family 1 protein [Candidatus Bathyarchaeota archaeon]
MARVFPEGFLWGTAISSFQSEMGLGAPSDRTDWWKWVHDEANVEAKRVSGDTPLEGPGFWELYDEDFRLAREELGNNAIRLAVDWGRVFPESTEEVEVDVKRDLWNNVWKVDVSEEDIHTLDRAADGDSVLRYREMLKSARRHGLTPMLSLYHWPIPLWLHDPIACRDDMASTDKRGWITQRTIVEFAKLSAYLSHRLGDLVDLYCTVNEPRIISEHSYLSKRGEFPPGLNDPSLFLTCLKHTCIAHGVAYEQVKKWDRAEASTLGPSTVGVVAVLQSYMPSDPSDAGDVWASRFIDYAYNEWNLNAIFHGDYDMNLDMVVQPWEQLPHQVKGCDYIGVNYYCNWRVKKKGVNRDPLLDFEFTPCTGDCSDYGWETYPEGLRNLVSWAYRRYRRPIYITENGIADEKDVHRTSYLKSHLAETHKAITLDGVPVKGYFHWTLTDSFEWSDGYRIHFGLYNVDRKTKKRTPTKAVQAYREIAENNSLDE